MHRSRVTHSPVTIFMYRCVPIVNLSSDVRLYANHFGSFSIFIFTSAMLKSQYKYAQAHNNINNNIIQTYKNVDVHYTATKLLQLLCVYKIMVHHGCRPLHCNYLGGKGGASGRWCEHIELCGGKTNLKL